MSRVEHLSTQCTEEDEWSPDGYEGTLFCEHCGWIHPYGASRVVNNHPALQETQLRTYSRDEIELRGWWRETQWSFVCVYDSALDDWTIIGTCDTEIGLYEPGSVRTREEAVAYILDTMGVVGGNVVQPTEFPPRSTY